MRKPQPWHKVADKMRQEGATLEDIAWEVNRSATTVCRYLNPDYDQRQKKYSQDYQRKRYQEDPVWRAERRAYYRKKEWTKWAPKSRNGSSANASRPT